MSSGLERRLQALERRATRPGRALLETSENVALSRLLPEEDKRTILDLFETEDGGREDTETALNRATLAQLAAYRRYDSLAEFSYETLCVLEARVAEDPEALTCFLQSGDEFWKAIEDHGHHTLESRQAARRFQRERVALLKGADEWGSM